MSLPVEIVVCTILLPAIVSGGLAAAVSRLRGKWSGGLAIAVAAGLVAGYLALPWTPWWPEDSWQRVAYLAVAAALLAAVGPLLGADFGKGWLLPLAASTGAAWLLVPTWEELRPRWLLWWVLLTAWMFTTWTLWAQRGLRRRPGQQLVLLAVTLSAAVPVLILSGNLKFAQLMMAAGVSAGVAVVVGAACERPGGPTDFAVVLAVALPGLLLNGYFYSFSGIPLLSYLMTLAAPAAWLGIDRCPAKGPRRRTWWLVGWAAAVLLPAAAVMLAALAT
ncbi:MAG: hypothetical protein GTO03_13280 [Planctomycetales bacterium]|nr:hypothetical protein [Planctomycetales bacterium]